jgi:hypothetical protein
MPTLKDRILQLVSSTHGITDTQLAGRLTDRQGDQTVAGLIVTSRPRPVGGGVSDLLER